MDTVVSPSRNSVPTRIRIDRSRAGGTINGDQCAYSTRPLADMSIYNIMPPTNRSSRAKRQPRIYIYVLDGRKWTVTSLTRTHIEKVPAADPEFCEGGSSVAYRGFGSAFPCTASLMQCNFYKLIPIKHIQKLYRGVRSSPIYTNPESDTAGFNICSKNGICMHDR